MSCPQAGCGSAPRVIASGQDQPWAIAVDATGIYSIDNGSGMLMQCPLSSCTECATHAIAVRPGEACSNLALDESSVYFITSQTLARVPK